MAIAELHAGRPEKGDEPGLLPVEAFVSPDAWRDIASRGDAPNAVALVVTGALQPPTEGAGALQLLAFDARDGRTRVRLDLPMDDSGAGDFLANAIEQLGVRLGATVGPLQGLRGLDWAPLESVLQAERWALHGARRSGPHDRLAAMAHLERAIQEAPAARYPVERLASLALEGNDKGGIDERFAAAAARALERAAEDAPDHVEIVESLAILDLRAGRARRAVRRLEGAIAQHPRRARSYPLLAQCLRAQGNADAALTVLQSGEDAAGADASLLSERGSALAMKGETAAAAVAWQRALELDPVHPPAFIGLAGLTSSPAQATVASNLADAALAAPNVHPDVLRHAVRLVLATEAEGLPRAARVASLCKKLLAVDPNDAWALLALARAHAALGEAALARERLTEILRMTPDSAPASEAQVLRQALDDPALGRALEALLRAAHTAPESELEGVAARARRLATLHDAWPGWLAAAVAERRQGRWAAARNALAIAIELAPGAPGAHLELSRVRLALGEAAGARAAAEKAAALEGETPRALLAMAEALEAEGRRAEAGRAAARVLAMEPASDAARALLEGLNASAERKRKTWLATVRAWFAGH
jgi:tetratricopeptide (TPR) repeat protein